MPIPVRTTSNRGPTGVAQVRIMSRIVKVQFDDGDLYEFSKEDCPDELLNAPFAKKSDPVELSVSLSPDGGTIFNVRPASASHIVKFNRFTAPRDQSPTPKLVERQVKQRRKDGRSFVIDEHFEYFGLLEIVAGNYEGMDLLYSMWYLWVDEDGIARLEGPNRRVQENIDLLRFAGVDLNEDTIPYTDNVIPYLESLLQRLDTPFLANLNGRGWIDSISALPEGVDLAPKKKKAKRKTAAKKKK